MKRECPDCSVSVCGCGNCHTMHCDSEQLCGYSILTKNAIARAKDPNRKTLIGAIYFKND